MLVNYTLMPIAVERFLCKRTFFMSHDVTRQFKTIPKFNTARKLLEKFNRERELKIYKGRILTIPNILTISRITVSPLFPFLIINGHLKSAFALLAYCGATDFVRLRIRLNHYILFCYSSTDGSHGGLIKSLF